MHTAHNVDLAPFTTFGLHAVAETFVCAETVDDVRAALSDRGTKPLHILGGGSNVLLTGDVKGLVLHVSVKGRGVIREDAETVDVRFGAGETWHDAVTWCVEQGWGGLENLALIPGTVGAAPMQNIGAYGVEQDACFLALDYVDIETMDVQTVDASFCAFGYRESIFKRALRDKVVITSVTYRLSKQHVVQTHYADVRNELAAMHCMHPTIRDVYDAVVAIRRRKLPDPSVIGNAGSFFKNPVVDEATFHRLHVEHPELPSYPQPDGTVKLPAAWLIDRCGWKGHREGDAGVHAHQALVLVNHGSATGARILELATRIAEDVHATYGVTLEREVNVW